MINKDDLRLSYEQKRKYKKAIEDGYFDDYQKNPREWKHSFCGTFLWKYPTRTCTLNRLRDVLGHIPQWSDITDELLTDFVDECQEQDLTPSSIRTMCAELKAVINLNRRKVKSEEFRQILSVKGTTSQSVYLTRDEMMKIINYTPVGEIERAVRRNFIVEMLTGARMCDAEKLTMSNCNMDTNTLSYVPIKTPNIVVTVPVDERLSLRSFLAEGNLRECTNKLFNRVIRRICKECHIDGECTILRRGASTTEPKWKFVSSHTARRTFATNLYLAGVSLEDVALLMGHGKNIETTKRYICAERHISPSILSYFQNT